MFCQNCGRQLNDGENFCPACGAMNAARTNENAAPIDFQYDFGTSAPVNEVLKDEKAGQIFKWGLMGLIFACTGCLSLLGFIFSIVAKSQAASFERVYGEIKGRAQAGRILGRIGFGLGLGMTILGVVYGFIVIIELAALATL